MPIDPQPQPPPLADEGEPPFPPPLPDTLASADSTGPTLPISAAAMQPAAGAEPVAGYRLVRLLGRGGFGEVWEAVGPGGFPVALKFVRLAAKVAAAEQRALDLMKRLRHPNLLGLHGAWSHGEYLILAMELAERTLLDRLHEAVAQGQTGIPLPELLRYLREAATGIDYLNEQGVQHRDIKPHNLLLVGGAVKVGDFGLAKLLHATLASATGSMTAAYASPEAYNDQVSRWSDQYSLAVTYCQLRGNRLPFEGPPAVLVAGHLMGTPDLSMVDEAERPALQRALAKKPHERWPSCAAFVEALAGNQARPVPRGCPPGQEEQTVLVTIPVKAAPRWSPWAVGACGLALLAAVLLAVLVGQHALRDNVQGKPPDKQPAGPPPTLKNSLGMELVRIGAGKFTMGSLRTEPGRRGDEEEHEVEITKPFYLGKYEVTRGEFAAFVKATGHKTDAEKDGKGGKGFNASTGRLEGPRPHYTWQHTGFEQNDRHPVVNVSWNDAVAFCKWLSAKEGKTYRLPTEAEWEYACRAGTRTRFHNGDDPEALVLAGNVADASGKKRFPDWTKATRAEDGYVFTAPVGQFKANAWGLCDMHGNVWEWCQDAYQEDYYQNSARKDPQGPAPTEEAERVMRGGSWYHEPPDCRSAARIFTVPVYRDHDVGFRVVLVP